MKKRGVRRFVLGTAGHVDHGKTALVKALTQVDTDRLPEEKKRGLTIELGFAPLRLSPHLMAGIVDVPGHQKFVETMVAGVNGVDALLLVVAADEGIKPQTQEHIEIAHFLGLSHGVCALTKMDLVSAADLKRRQEEIHSTLASTTLKNFPILPVSSVQSKGISSLTKALQTLGENLPEGPTSSTLTIPVDRVFSRPGFGTVVTGTLSGEPLKEGDRLQVWPGKTEVTARSIEVFNERLKQIEPTSRVAVNLSGPGRERITRSSWLVRPGSVKETARVFVQIRWSQNVKPKRGEAFKLLIGTGSHEVRWFPYSSKDFSLGELRLKKPIPIWANQRFILRMPSPARTVGGGSILDPHPHGKLKDASLKEFLRADWPERFKHWLQSQPRRVQLKDFILRSGLSEEACRNHLSSKEVVWMDDQSLVHQALLDQLTHALHEKIKESDSMPLASLSKEIPALADPLLKETVLEHLQNTTDAVVDQDRLRAKPKTSHGAHPLVGRFKKEGLTPPTTDLLAQELGMNSKELLQLLSEFERDGWVTRLSHQLYCHTGAVTQAQGLLQKHFESEKQLTIGQWKELVQVSRKYAVPLLEHFDRARITLCKPDRTRIAGPKLKQPAA